MKTTGFLWSHLTHGHIFPKEHLMENGNLIKHHIYNGGSKENCTRRKKGRPPNNIKTKMFNFEARVLIGWLSQSFRSPANQNACFIVKHFCFKKVSESFDG